MNEIEQLQKKVSALENILQREREARKQAELQLEESSRKIYESNQELKQQLEEDKTKQKQLSFMTGLSADTWQAETVNAIVSRFLNRSCDFLAHSFCIYYQICKNSPSKIQLVKSETRDVEIGKQLLNITEQVDTDKLENILAESNFESQIIALSEISELPDDDKFLFVVPIFNIKNNLGLAMYFYADINQVNVLKLQTMEASRSMLSVAIQRKLTAETLNSRYKELKSTHNKLEQAQAQLVQSEKMASLGQLAAGVAHEINNPVGFILSNFETLYDYIQVVNELLSHFPSLFEKGTSEEALLNKINQLWQEEDVEFIVDDLQQIIHSSKQGLNRVKEIVSGLKSFSHAGDAKRSEIDLDECVDEAVQLVWNEIKYNCEVKRDFAEVSSIVANAGQLQQVFVNLMVNAQQAMKESGTITIKLWQEADMVKLSFTDTGSGISQENLEKLFTPFFTTKPVGVGTGLGLSISYGIVQEHGGNIEAESEVGVGTTFILSFPAARD